MNNRLLINFSGPFTDVFVLKAVHGSLCQNYSPNRLYEVKLKYYSLADLGVWLRQKSFSKVIYLIVLTLDMLRKSYWEALFWICKTSEHRVGDAL